MRFQARHGLAPTRHHDAAHARCDERSRAEADQAARGFAGAPREHEFLVRPALCGRQPAGGLRRGGRERQGGAALSRHRRQDRKAVADADRRNHQRQSQPDLDRAVVDLEDRNLGAYAQGSRLSLPHAHGSARRPRRADRSACGRLVRHAHAELHRAPAIRHLECARRGQDRHAEPLFGLHARHQPAQFVQRRLPLRLAWLLAGRQCARPRRLAAAGRNAEMESRRDRCRDRHRPARGHRAAEEGSGGLDLSDRPG